MAYYPEESQRFVTRCHFCPGDRIQGQAGLSMQSGAGRYRVLLNMNLHIF
jgi:hypothetical protein